VPELSALSPFRWELAERERFQKPKDDPHTAGETFCANSAIVLLLTELLAPSAENCGTHPRDWAGCPPKHRKAHTPALSQFENPAIRGDGADRLRNCILTQLMTIVVSQVESCASPLNWFQCLKAAKSASCTASSASSLFPKSLYAYRWKDDRPWGRTDSICSGEGFPESRATFPALSIDFSSWNFDVIWMPERIPEK
jgi:hypothetical protein